MRRLILAATAIPVAVALPAAAGASIMPLLDVGKAGCQEMFTPAMGERAARAVYRGTRTATLQNLRLLGYIERCQRDPRDQDRVRTYDRHNAELNNQRRHPPQPVQPSGWRWPWSCIARYESGGDPSADTGNGYLGGLQFSIQTWNAYGGQGNPASASIEQQEAVAERVLAAQGWGAWPNTSRICGL